MRVDRREAPLERCATPRRIRGGRVALVAGTTALLAACPGPSGTCGVPAGVTGSTMMATGGADTVQYGTFTPMANNDCPDPDDPSVVSITFAAAQTTPTGMAFLTLCLPRPDRVPAAATDLAIGTDIQLVDVQGDFGDCSWSAVTGATGTATLEGFCGVADGSALTLDASATVTKHCASGGADQQVTVTLSGTSLVPGN